MNINVEDSAPIQEQPPFPGGRLCSSESGVVWGRRVKVGVDAFASGAEAVDVSLAVL